MYTILLLISLLVPPYQSEILGFILKEEAGLNLHDVKSAGGKSYAGITQTTWRAWRETQPDKDKLPLDIELLVGQPTHINPINSKGARLDLIKRFYFDYFDEYHTWDVHPILQLIYADMVVLSGHEAIRIIQEMANLKSDGVWGSRTSIAVQNMNRILDSGVKQQYHYFRMFDSRKRKFLQSLIDRHPMTYGHFHDTWFSRADAVKQITLKRLGIPNNMQ